MKAIYDIARRAARPTWKSEVSEANRLATRHDILSRIDKESPPHGTKAATIELALQLAQMHRYTGRPLAERLQHRLVALCEEQILERNLSTPAGWDEFAHVITDRAAGLWVVTGSGYYKYSARAGSWHQSASYLCGREDGQYWTVRLPGTITAVDEALQWLKPAAIRQAEAKGLPVKRQGDIYFRPMRIKEHDMRALWGTRHDARPRKGGALTIVHPEHKPIILSAKYHWRAYQQTQVDGNGRSAGD
jgi:hypothetical protein